MFRHKILSMVILAGMLFSQSVPLATAASGCDSAQFVSDLTIPDGSTFAPSAAFTKSWRLLNNGTCTWDTSYSLVWAGGDAMGPSTAVKLPVSVPPGQMLDISVNLVAPNTAGHYKSLWKLSNASGTQFGIGDSGNDPFWADINVIDINAVVYDFVANAPYAQWKSGAGILPYPGTSGDSRGYSYQVNNPHLEDDSYAPEPGLLTVPQNKYNGYIQATYPEFQVQAGDRLQTLVNCEFGATGCYVSFRIDYIQANGVQKTFWTWKEAYDKRFYRANLDLTPLAGQRVKFVFMLLSSGLASGDRAIWGSPRIVRTGTTQPPAPPATLTALPPLTPTATPMGAPPPTIQPAGCDRATFVTDVTVQDGTTFAPGAAFTKTWRLKNSGSCVWTTAYKLVYYSGEQMSAPTTVNLPWGAVNGQTVDISVNMTAPSGAGQYRGFWILSNASGQFFGIGANAADPIWVQINVAGDSPGNAASYDFLANACSAEWKSGAGALPCPGTDNDSRGFILSLNPAKLEDGSASSPGLLTFPQNRYNGYIQGFYPTFTVQPGDHFQSNVGCEFGSNCYVTFRLDYMAANGYIGTFWQWREQADGKSYQADVDLTPLAGRSVRFILTTLATGYATNDRAVWAAPRIVRAATGPSPSTATPSSTPVPPQWLTYANQPYGFQFMYPPQGQILSQSPTYLKMNLPFTPGTNLVEKYLETVVVENANPCQSLLSSTSPPGSPTETIVINGIPFFKQVGGDAAAGNHYEWVAYSTLQGNACISMDFMLHSLGAIDPPPPNYDKAAESAMFTQIMSTFGWTSLPPTVTPSPTAASSSPIPSPNISQLFMIDGINGWALADPYVVLTRDGGATWYNVTMPGNTGTIRSAFFPNVTTGWVITNFAGTNLGSLYRTTNGGLNWTRFDVPFNSGYIQFLDNNNGFVLYGEGSGMQKQAVALYQTADGGATWTLKYNNDPTIPNPGTSLPFGGHKNGMAFRDTSTGWVGGDIPTNGFAYLYKTTNSGVTWSPVSIPLPAGYESAYVTTTAPKFFGGNDAILPVMLSLNTGRDLFLYTSHDGGNTWSASPGFVRDTGPIDIITMSNTIIWNWAGYFQATGDAGANWSQVTPNVNFGDSARTMDFVSPASGWMVDTDQNGTIALYRTSDGGATWTLLFGNTAPSPQIPTNTPTPTAATQSPADVLQSVVNALNAKNFAAAKGLMGPTFGMGYWQSQGNSYPPDGAIQQLQTNYIGPSTVLTADPSRDLSALLQGVNPYSIMGLDPATSQALFVSGWGLDGKGEAILYVTKGSDEKWSWNNVLIAPTGFAPLALIGPYAVVNVAPNDVLNIRVDAGSSQQVNGSFPYNATNVMRTGPTANAEGVTWFEIQNPSGGLGWVNSSYLTEYITHDAFCADTRIPGLLEQLKGSMNQSNGDIFASIVSPAHGVNVHLWAYAPAVNFTASTAQTAFASQQVYNWGSGGQSGYTDSGTFSQIIQPKMQDVMNAPNMETYCDILTKVYPLSNPWPYTNIHYYNLYKPASEQTLDFRTWLIGIEYINGQPYLYSLVTIPWEP